MKLEVDSEGFSAYIIREEGEKITSDALFAFLRKNGIIRALRKDGIVSLLSGTSRKKVLVAKVDPVKDMVEFLIEFADDRPMLQDGRVNFKERFNITTVREGQVIARLREYVLNVKGEPIPVIPDPEKLQRLAGENVEFKKNELIAKVDGEVYTKGEKVCVSPVYHVFGNVNIKTGNIRFPGSVFIEGDVEDGFTVEAGVNVTVNGNVGKSIVKAQGEVKVRGGVKSQGKIESGGSVTVSFAEGASLYSEKDIKILSYASHSELMAERDVMIQNEIRDGIITAGRQILVENVRCSHKTVLEVGIPPRVRRSIEGLQEKIEKLQEEVERLGKDLAALSKRTDQKAQERLEVYSKNYATRSAELKVSLKKYKKLTEEIKKSALEVGAIVVRSQIQSGTILRLFEREITVIEDLCDIAFISMGRAISLMSAREYFENRKRFGL